MVSRDRAEGWNAQISKAFDEENEKGPWRLILFTILLIFLFAITLETKNQRFKSIDTSDRTV